MLFPVPHQANQQRRVVVTGAGAITCLGQGWCKNEEALRRGVVGIKPVSLFDVSRQRVKVAGQVELPEKLANTPLTHAIENRMERAGRLLWMAANEAWQQCGWESGEHVPIVLGTTSGGMTLGEDLYRHAVEKPDKPKGQIRRIVQYQAQRQGLNLADAFGLSGPLTIIANACASGANAVGHAWQLVRQGAAERVLTGGYDALCQLVFAGFDSLQAMSPTQCRPFDATRDGLALGEGAAGLALECLEAAQKRGAQILGEIVGYGATTDLHHLTQPQPNGDAAYASMRIACNQARVNPEQIGYINAHGTGTPLNDSAEALAINRWAGDYASQIRVSSTKSGIGHLLGAAGAVEVLICLMALKGQWLPPMTTVHSPDPLCRFRVVREPEEHTFEYALTNSFGFGGSNASVVLRRWS